VRITTRKQSKWLFASFDVAGGVVALRVIVRQTCSLSGALAGAAWIERCLRGWLTLQQFWSCVGERISIPRPVLRLLPSGERTSIIAATSVGLIRRTMPSAPRFPALPSRPLAVCGI
jgi:hypothetical protein